MTDLYLQPEVHIVITQSPGIDGAGTTAQLAQIESDLATMLARPVINALSDVPDVGTPSADGQTPIWDADTQTWVPGMITSSIAMHTLGGALVRSNVAKLYAGNGIEFAPTVAPDGAWVGAAFGGTGVSNAVSRSDHAHTVLGDTPFSFAATGVLSSGTRTLISSNVTGLDPAKTYVIKGVLYLHMRGDGAGASYALPRVWIYGNSRDGFEDSRLVAGVQVTEVTPHPGQTITGVSSVTVAASVAYRSGDPSFIGAGVLMIDVSPNR